MKREHGTRACYVFGRGPGQGKGCRCEPCTAANRTWASARDRQMLYGRWQPFTDAGPLREHLRMLSAAGIGWKRAADLAGVSRSTVSQILHGKPGRPPVARIRPETAARILAVSTSADLAPAAPVDATAARRRLQALVALGWSQAKLAGRLGMTPSNFGTMLDRGQVHAATDRAVAALYRELWDRAPDESTHRAKISASRARNYARGRGWPPPMAWDDERIADPGAKPADGWQRPARANRPAAELAAEAEELIGWGYSRADAAERLGVTTGALEKAFERVRKAAA